ncbi:SMR family transporter [Polaromonas sp. YR568]|uniref:SMR family transporter n=1 Tax=Polaromonas sp. YR568 TaxID=1855301 RepID=UPI0031378F42
MSITPAAAWLVLLIADIMETVWAISIKASDGFTEMSYGVVTIIAAGLNFWLLGLALSMG